MGTDDDGLTLQGLARKLETQAQKLEAVERENTELRHKVATLEGSATDRNEIAALRGSDTHRDQEEPVSEFEGRVSRRSLLSKAGAAAVAAVAAGTLVYPRQAKANHYADGISVDHVITHFISAQANDTGGTAVFATTVSNNNPAVDATNNGNRPGVRGWNNGTGIGVQGFSAKGEGVWGTGVIGVYGSSGTTGQAGVYATRGLADSQGPGVVGDGLGPDYAGVLGRNQDGTGVWGQSSKTGYSGVYGQHTGTAGYGIVGDGKGETGAGVLGRNNDGTGVHGQSSKTGYGGVTAQHTGSAGYGVIGLGTGATGAGVLGRNSSGNGVQGEGKNGVHGKAQGGYGGQFEGGRAQLRLVPKGTVGKPTTGAHAKGEIYMDSTGTLFVCTANGTPGTWKKVTTTTA